MPLKAGTFHTIQSNFTNKWFISIAVSGVLFASFLFFLIFYMLDRRDKKLLMFYVATDESYYDRNRRKIVQSDSHEVTVQSAAGGLADTYFAMLTKGSCVYVEGPVRTRRVRTDDGEDRLTRQIRAEKVIRTGGRGRGKVDAPPFPGAPEEDNNAFNR